MLLRGIKAQSCDPASSRGGMFVNSCCTPVLNTTHPNTHALYKPLCPKAKQVPNLPLTPDCDNPLTSVPSLFLPVHPTLSPLTPTHKNSRIQGSADANVGIIHMSHVTCRLLRGAHRESSQPEPSLARDHSGLLLSASGHKCKRERGDQMIRVGSRGSEASI